jgi:alkylation response protein AidB-like acyl-CoA dehydrogenase
VSNLDEFRAGVRAVLEERLTPRRADGTFTVLGAGSDDLEAGRRYLRALADGGWAVPTWPREYGGLDAMPKSGQISVRTLSPEDHGSNVRSRLSACAHMSQ